MPIQLPINPLDGLIVLGLLLGTAWGFNTGFLRQLLGVVCIYLSATASAILFPGPSRWLAVHLHLSVWLTDVLVFGIFLTGIYVLLMHLAKDMLQLSEKPLIGTPDRIGGMLAGLFLAAIWLGFLLIMFEYALGVRWLRWDYLRRAFLDNYSTSILASPLKQISYLIVYTVKPLFPKGVPRMLQP